MHYRVSSIFWLIIGVYIAVHAYQLGLGRFRQPGPGLIFFLAAVFLVILSTIDLANNIIGESQNCKDTKDHPVWVELRWHKVLLVLGGLSAYVYFFNIAGFIFSTFLLMIFLFKGVEPTKWWVAIVSSLITTFLSYYIFEIWLEVPFRKGFLGF
jgi:cytochrome c oxidase subunit IV